jgi:predicted cupin superfamily sugar epimerase
MTTRPTAEELIETLSLRPHPEGGWYREVYRSPEEIVAQALAPRYGGERRMATSILFMLQAGEISALHRVSSDETWLFHMGDPLELVAIDENGAIAHCRLGHDLAAGHVLQRTVPHGAWQGARVVEGGAYALVGCVVAPGFDFKDFEMGERAALLERYPQHAALIRRLTNPETA